MSTSIKQCFCMGARPLLAVLGLVLSAAPWPAHAVGEGLMPVPVLKDVRMGAEVSLDADPSRYVYAYTVSNPAASTGQIWHIDIDITHNGDTRWMSSAGLTLPLGKHSPTFDEYLSDAEALLGIPPGSSVVPIGQQVPAGWGGRFGLDGFAGFFSHGPSYRISPGQTGTGFRLISPGVPAIRAAIVEPWWVLVVPDVEDVSEEEEQGARDIEEKIQFHTFTLGPSGVVPGSFEHWNLLRDNLNQAIQLGWISDVTLGNTLVAQLASARAALDAGDGTLAKQRLHTLLATMAQSPAASRRLEVRDLVDWNARKLLETTSDTPVPFEPKVTLAPPTTRLALGTTYTLTATVINLGDNKPIADFPLTFEVSEGPHGIDSPHAAEQVTQRTDAGGKASFSYAGTQLGTDKIRVFQQDEAQTEYGGASVTWEGGPDLVIERFIPPVIRAKGGDAVTIYSEMTANAGTSSAGSSSTGYFLSNDERIDPREDTPLTERPVQQLAPGQSSEVTGVRLTLPASLAQGTYHLGACADVAGNIPELDETNNCQPNQIILMGEPGPIEDLAARAKDGKIDLVWSAIQGAIGYNIYRSTAPGGPYQRIKAGHTSSYATYLDLGLTNGVTYYYTVRWTMDGWESPPSNEARATPVAGRTR